MRRWQNVGGWDRVIRVAVGLLLLYVGVFTGVVIADVFSLVGAVLIVTGVIGYCPLYGALQISTRRHHPGPDRGHRAA